MKRIVEIEILDYKKPYITVAITEGSVTRSRSFDSVSPAMDYARSGVVHGFRNALVDQQKTRQ